MKFLTDEDIPRAIVRGVKRQRAEIDIVRVQDVGLRTKPDPEILQWAAEEGRIVVSRDKSTMPDHAAERIRHGKAMPGLFLVSGHWQSLLRQIIDDLVLIDECSEPGEWENQIRYLPLWVTVADISTTAKSSREIREDELRAAMTRKAAAVKRAEEHSGDAAG